MPGGVADMSDAGLCELMAIIEQDLEVLRRTAIHGSGEMKELAIARLQASGQKLNPKIRPRMPPMRANRLTRRCSRNFRERAICWLRIN